jgi:NADH-quinone oxidoreductase subunit J
MVAQLLFFFLAAVAITAGLGMLLSRSPVNSALWLVLNFFCIAGLYIILSATFIGVIQVLVYAGAIMVLFLFVIMLLNLEAPPALAGLDWTRVAGFLVGMGLLAQLIYVVAEGFGVTPVAISSGEALQTGEAAFLAESLFTRYALPLEITALLLLAATVGAVMLAKRRFE